MATALTGSRIIGDFIRLLRQTALPGKIGGDIYRSGLRPRDSHKEDLVVILTDAGAEQFQSGTVTLNLYVPLIRNSVDGVMVENGRRCEELEEVVAKAVSSITAASSQYLLSLSEAVRTRRDDETGQSFIVARIGFKHFG